MRSSPIGVFDSGSGGLSIWQAVHAVLPAESLVYIGDHANIPYGGKSTEFIRERVVQSIEFLIKKNCKLIVIACNTATIAGIDYVRAKFPQIPIVGVVPVIKTAASISTTKHFVVLSTQFTTKSLYQKDLIKKWANDCTVINVGSSLLVPLIEDGQVDGENIEKELRRVFAPFQNEPYDVIALGCTHYPFIRGAITKVLGDRAQIIDSSGAIVRQVVRILDSRNDRSDHFERELFFTTGDTKKVGGVFKKILGRFVEIGYVTL